MSPMARISSIKNVLVKSMLPASNIVQPENTGTNVKNSRTVL